MIMRRANRLLTGAIILVATGEACAVWPVAADSIDKGANLAQTEIRRAAPQLPSEPSAESAPAGNPVWAISLAQLSATRDRPIFSPSRRPAPPPAAAPIYMATSATAAQPERPSLKLVGTAAGVNDAIAIFVERTTGTVIRLHAREGYEGWILRSVRGREAMLQKGHDSTVITLAPPGGGAGQETAQASAEPTRTPSLR
jgi:general secretion pathway protein N